MARRHTMRKRTKMKPNEYPWTEIWMETNSRFQKYKREHRGCESNKLWNTLWEQVRSEKIKQLEFPFYMPRR